MSSRAFSSYWPMHRSRLFDAHRLRFLVSLVLNALLVCSSACLSVCSIASAQEPVKDFNASSSREARGRLDVYVFNSALLPSDHITFKLQLKSQGQGQGQNESERVRSRTQGAQVWLKAGDYIVHYRTQESRFEDHPVFHLKIVERQSVEVIFIDHPAPRPPSVEIESPQALSQSALKHIGEHSGASQGTATRADDGPRRALRGIVHSASTKEPLSGVRVFVRGDHAQAETDQRGLFNISVPSRALKLTFLHHQHATLHHTLSADHPEEESLSITLQPQSHELEDAVIILPKIDQSSVLAQLERRKRSVSVSDALSLDDIKKSADSNASSATRRIVGATVVGGSYLNVRGLGGRYTSVRLNGVALPSTDPDLPGFQIDLFPVSLLTSLQIDKTFRPSIPGNFAGGSMDIRTRDFSLEDQLSVSLSLSSDTQSFLTPTFTPSRQSGDWIGMGSASRSLPSGFPNQRVSRSRTGLDREAIIAAGRSLPVDWEGEKHTLAPNLSLGFRYSGSRRDLIGQRVGYLVTAGYRNESTLRSGEVANVRIEGSGDERVLSLRESLARQRARLGSKLGALGALSVKLTDWDELRWISVLTQTGDNQWTSVEGLSESEGLPIEQTQLQYLERQLLFHQLIGTHEDIYADLDLAWRLNYAQVQRQQPDSRDVLYVKLDQGYAYRNVTGSGERLFSGLEQSNLGGGLDLKTPLSILSAAGELKLGGMFEYADRTWSARRFGTQIVSGTQEDRLVSPNTFFARDRYGEMIDLVELTRPSDGYENQSRLFAGYLSHVAQLRSDLKMMVGARYESFQQDLSVASPFAQDAGDQEQNTRHDQDILPALSLIYSLSPQTQLRFSYGGTVARPLVREVAPFLQQDFVRRRTITGNPDLQRTWIDNLDLRVEWFPSAAEVFALSLFAKRFDAPIESIIKDQNGNLGYENTPEAQNAGVELEARLQLKRVSDHLKAWQVMGNMTWTYSSVSLSEDQASFVTSQSRPLQGQSPYVMNLGLSYEPKDWSASLFYNVFGPRIVDVGMFGIPDVFEQPFHSLDFNLSWTRPSGLSVGLSVQNILMQTRRLEQDRFPFQTIDPGLKAGVRVGYQFDL